MDADRVEALALLRVWLAAAKTKLADPGTLDGRAFARVGELVISAAHYLAEQERDAAVAAEIAQRSAARRGGQS